MNYFRFSGFRSLLYAALIALFTFPSDTFSEDFVDAAITALKSRARNGDLLADCPSYQGMTPKGGCTRADPAGFGLHCGKTTHATGGATEKCQRNIMSVLRGMLGREGLARLEGSSLNTAQMSAEIEPQESVSHDHSVFSSEGTDSCDTAYIKRKDFVKFRFGVYNSAKVSVSITTPNWGTFQGEVEKSEGFTAYDEVLICGWMSHPAPRACTRTY